MMRIPLLALPAVLALVGCAAPAEIHDVPYDNRFGDQTTMDIYLPAGEPARSPAIMMIHGGAWRFGTKDAYRDAAVRYARSGWVAVSINYRLGPAGVYPRAVQDCVCALAYLRAHADDYGIDPNRIAVTGYSAGGHLASLVGVAGDAPCRFHLPDSTYAERAGRSGAGLPAERLREFLSQSGQEREAGDRLSGSQMNR